MLDPPKIRYRHHVSPKSAEEAALKSCGQTASRSPNSRAIQETNACLALPHSTMNGIRRKVTDTWFRSSRTGRFFIGLILHRPPWDQCGRGSSPFRTRRRNGEDGVHGTSLRFLFQIRAMGAGRAPRDAKPKDTRIPPGYGRPARLIDSRAFGPLRAGRPRSQGRLATMSDSIVKMTAPR